MLRCITSRFRSPGTKAFYTVKETMIRRNLIEKTGVGALILAMYQFDLRAVMAATNHAANKAKIMVSGAKSYRRPRQKVV